MEKCALLEMLNNGWMDAVLAGPEAGEFFRLLYDAPSDTVYGYPNRAMAMLVSSSFQTDHNLAVLSVKT